MAHLKLKSQSVILKPDASVKALVEFDSLLWPRRYNHAVAVLS